MPTSLGQHHRLFQLPPSSHIHPSPGKKVRREQASALGFPSTPAPKVFSDKAEGKGEEQSSKNEGDLARGGTAGGRHPATPHSAFPRIQGGQALPCSQEGQVPPTLPTEATLGLGQCLRPAALRAGLEGSTHSPCPSGEPCLLAAGQATLSYVLQDKSYIPCHHLGSGPVQAWVTRAN